MGCQVFVTLAIGAALLGCILCLLPAAGQDQMWFLMMADRWLHGATLYGPLLFDSNPPLIVWLSAVPVAIAKLLHLSTTTAGKALVVALEAGVWAVCLRLSRSLGRGISRTSVWALAFAFLAVFACVPARDFGQREHLLSLLCLPYLVAAALAMQGRPIRGWKGAFVGVSAGIGFALKPHQLLVPIAVEALVLCRGRRSVRIESRLRRGALRLEPFLLAGACALYVAAIRLLAPQYFTRALPVLWSTYWAIGSLGPRELFQQAIQLHILGLVAIALALLVARFTSHNDPARTITAVLIVAGIAGTVAYYIQGTGWYYQQIPALSFFALAAWVDLLTLTDIWELRAPRWTLAAAGCICVLAIAAAAGLSGYRLSRPFDLPSGLGAQPDPEFFAGLEPGTPVAILTTEVGLSIPPVYTRDLFWAQRMNNLWTLPAILRNESSIPGEPRRTLAPDRVAELDRMQHLWMVEDLNRWQPRLVLIERCQDAVVHCPSLTGRHDDLLAWFATDAAFRAVFAQYRYARTEGPFDAYVRK